jgi:hypothetical protein
MPFQNFICEVTGEPTPPQACLACARSGALPGCPMTAPVVKGILANMRPDDFGVTITTLLGCPRKFQLKQEWDYNLRPSEMWWAYRGQLMHDVSARYAQDDPNAVVEQRYSVMVEAPEGLNIISGQPDLVYLDRRHILDFKTIKAVPGAWRAYTCPETGALIREGPYAWRPKMIACPHCFEGEHVARQIVHESPPRAKKAHVQQVSLYRLVLAEHGVAVDTAEIVYMDMREQLRIPVELLPLDEAWKLIEQRLALFTTGSIPDILHDPEEFWECDFCPVRGVCERLHGAPVGKSLVGEEAA